MIDLDALRALVTRLDSLDRRGGLGYDAHDLLRETVKALPVLLDELAAARRDAEDIRRAGEILADAPGLPLELLDEKELSKWTDAITGLVILFTDAIDAARGER